MIGRVLQIEGVKLVFVGRGLALGIGLGLTASIASAGSISGLGTDYDTVMLGFYENTSGFLDYQGALLADFVVFFDDAPAALSIFGTVTDPTSFAFGADFDLSGTEEVMVAGLADSVVGSNTLQYLFENGSTAYLVTITVSPIPGIPLDDDFASVDAPISDPNAIVKVDKYTNSSAAIPLPATMPLILAGIGGLALLRRRADQ